MIKEKDRRDVIGAQLEYQWIKRHIGSYSTVKVHYGNKIKDFTPHGLTWDEYLEYMEERPKRNGSTEV